MRKQMPPKPSATHYYRSNVTNILFHISPSSLRQHVESILQSDGHQILASPALF